MAGRKTIASPIADPVLTAYERMRSVAGRLLSRQASQHTLQPTALVHEAWLRLRDFGIRGDGEQDPSFLAKAARAMRHVLVDHARRKGAKKRRGAGVRIPLDALDEPIVADGDPLDAIAVDEAIERLAAADADLVPLAELRLFAGLSLVESAAVLGWPTTTTRNRWNYVVARLSLALRGEP